jgi:hypothetical protein
MGSKSNKSAVLKSFTDISLGYEEGHLLKIYCSPSLSNIQATASFHLRSLHDNPRSLSDLLVPVLEFVLIVLGFIDFLMVDQVHQRRMISPLATANVVNIV